MEYPKVTIERRGFWKWKYLVVEYKCGCKREYEHGASTLPDIPERERIERKNGTFERLYCPYCRAYTERKLKKIKG